MMILRKTRGPRCSSRKKDFLEINDEVWWSVAPALASWCSLWLPRNRTVASLDVAGGSVTVKDRPVHLEQYKLSIADILHLVVICDKWKGTCIVLDRDKIYKQTNKLESAELVCRQSLNSLSICLIMNFLLSILKLLANCLKYN